MDYQDKNFEYTDAEAYDRRGKSSILENYVLSLWQPFLKKIIGDLSTGKIVVDLGCGTCEYTQAAKNAKKIYAVDVSKSMLKVCREKLKNFPQAEIIQSSIQDFNIAEPAELMIVIGVWEYINPRDLYAKVKEITRRGSKVIVVFPNIYNKLNLARSLGRMKKIALRPGFIKKLFKKDFLVIDSASFGVVSWVPKKLQFLILPLWKFTDLIWRPFQKFLPLGVNVYYLFERK
ncbi:MAG: class I SAM-dependent methyltransferase [Candidatus Omnitrophota bacterium]|nr:class I SAM-dependent methyltransferase [Candidatus Omnitrophota bacterium]